jgi:riboflavin synthase alpha subunit
LADVSAETHEKTRLGGLPIGGSLQLERALAIGDRYPGALRGALHERPELTVRFRVSSENQP